MKACLRRLASLRLTLLAMLALAATALASYRNPDIPVSWVVAPLTVLAVNLLAAIVTNSQFRRQRGLLLFHLGLLAIATLAAAGVMMSMDARLEIAEGQAFDPAHVEITHLGRWHRNQLDQVRFTQGQVQIDYLPNLRRGDTRSQIWIPDQTEKIQSRIIGDKHTLTASGYRFITTGNKGYALILTWLGDEGSVSTGAVNMPSSPMYDWKQQNAWVTPHGQSISFSLQRSAADRVDANSAWMLDSRNVDAKLLVQAAGQEKILGPGEVIRLEQGSLRFEDVRLWMGYRIDYNPMLIWQFLAALFAVSGLGCHFWQKFFLTPLDTKILQPDKLEQAMHA